MEKLLRFLIFNLCPYAFRVVSLPHPRGLGGIILISDFNTLTCKKIKKQLIKTLVTTVTEH